MRGSEGCKRQWRGIATAASVLVLSFAMLAPGAMGAGGVPGPLATTYGGRAYAVGISVPFFGGTYYADTGSLPSSGGALFADFTPVDTDVSDALAFLAYTRGFKDAGASEVATMDVSMLEGSGYDVGATFVYAKSTAVCNGVSGGSEIADLTIGGVPFEVSGAPNEVIYSIPGVFTLTANEQTDSSFGTTKSITVNALHAWTPAVDVIVSSASSTVTCSGSGGLPLGGSVRTLSRSGGGIPIPMHVPPADFMTGGGFFRPPNAYPPHHVNFGFNAGPRPGNPSDVKGHVNVIDHDTGDHIQGTDVTDYFQFGDPQDVCRRFAGPATFNHVPGYRFDAVACDYGEPGRFDRFAFEVRLEGAEPGSDPVWKADNARANCSSNRPFCGDLDGGNIQLHRFG